MTQERLADLIDISVVTIGKIERGVAAPSFDTAERIAAALRLPVLSLFGVDKTSLPRGERGKLLAHIQHNLADMNDEQMARAARILDAFMGRL